MYAITCIYFSLVPSICSPSSLSLSSLFLLGRLPVRNGIFTDHPYPIDMAFRVFLPSNTGGLPSDEVTIPQVLKQGGYNSALVKLVHVIGTCTCMYA